MKKLLIIIAAITFIAILLISSAYNSLVSLDESANRALGDMHSAYQRRADLIPNLVATVKGYAEHEKGTLEAVVEARANATGTTINVGDPSSITQSQFESFLQAQDGLTSALSRLLAVVEAYPDLKANQGFLKLQDQLEGTENRINNERSLYNRAVREYNAKIRKFPTNLLAGPVGFKKKPYFESAEGAQNAPQIEL